MDHSIVDLINARINDVKEDIKGMDEKLDKLLQFKWQIIGGSLVLSSIISIIVSVVGFFLKKGE